MIDTLILILITLDQLARSPLFNLWFISLQISEIMEAYGFIFRFLMILYIIQISNGSAAKGKYLS